MVNFQYILTNIILPLVIGGIGAYLYPKIGSFFENRSRSSRQKKIEEIINEYKFLKYLSQDVSRLTAYLASRLVSGLVSLFMIVLLAIMVLLNPELQTRFPSSAILVAVAVAFISGRTAIYLNRAYERYQRVTFDDAFLEYKEKIILEIKKMGGNPAILDEEKEEINNKKISNKDRKRSIVKA